jgi:cell fate (sporulation/competence/biofilm development) regulator YlbF (YheA/YmcA/DUF963 family)
MLKYNIKKLEKSLQNSYIFKEYKELKDKIEGNKTLILLKKEINKTKQEITKNVLKDEIHSSLVEKYNRLNNEYNNHPLIQNFEYIKEEIQNELNFIKEKINK